MELFKSLFLKLRAMQLQRQLDQDLEDEMAAHLALKQQALEREGLNSTTAKLQARRSFGNPVNWKESTRDLWIPVWLEGIWRDIRFSSRLLLKDRLFTATALLTLAIGIGANTAIFSMINDLMLRALPVKNPDQLASILITNLPPTDRAWKNGQEVAPADRQHISFALLQAIEKQDIFSGAFARCGMGQVTLTNKDALHQISPDWVTGSYFPVLGVKPFIGRFFSTEEDIAGGPEEGWPVVISEPTWNRVFQRSNSALGSRITIDKVSFTVIGVAPASFFGMSPGHQSDAWLPLNSLEQINPEMKWRDPGFPMLQSFVRLRSGVSLHQANERMKHISRSLFDEVTPPYQKTYRDHVLAQKIKLESARSGYSWIAQVYGKSLWILLSAVGAILFIAATNLTNLILARSTARRQEIAVRLAIGASAQRIRRQLLIESGLLAIIGSLLGIVSALWLTPLIQRSFSLGEWVHIDFNFDWGMLVFLTTILTLTILISGWIPAWHASRSGSLHTQANESDFSRWRTIFRSGLVVIQISLTVALLGAAGLLINSLRATFLEETGFDHVPKLFVSADLAGTGISQERLPHAFRNITSEVRMQPGVQAAAWTRFVPLTGELRSFNADAPGKISSAENGRMVHSHEVSDGYFSAIGIPFLAGRDFTNTPTGRKTCVVSENLARYFFGSVPSAIGQHINGGPLKDAEIIGVVGNSKYSHIREAAPMTAYFPVLEINPHHTLTLVIRYSSSREAVTTAVHTILRKETGRIPVMQIRTADENLSAVLSIDRLLATLLTAFSIFALIISITGITGLLSYSVQQRRKEIGIQMALGATPSFIQWQFRTQGIRLGIAGIALGGLLSFWLRHAIDSYLFGTKAGDPLVWISVILIFFICIFIAVAIPAWRASKIEPMQALRTH